MNKAWMALSGAAMYLGACSPSLDTYERNRCDIDKARVTELVSWNGTSTPFDDRVVAIISVEAGHPDCQERWGDSERNENNRQEDRPETPVAPETDTGTDTDDWDNNWDTIWEDDDV